MLERPLECKKCGSPKLYPIKGRRSFSCPKGHHTSPIATSPIRKSDTPLAKWHMAFKMLRHSQTTPALRIKQTVHVTYKTAWRMKKVILDNLGQFDRYFSPPVDNWDEKPPWLLALESNQQDKTFDDIITRTEFNYRQEAADSAERIIQKYGKLQA